MDSDSSAWLFLLLSDGPLSAFGAMGKEHAKHLNRIHYIENGCKYVRSNRKMHGANSDI